MTVLYLFAGYPPRIAEELSPEFLQGWAAEQAAMGVQDVFQRPGESYTDWAIRIRGMAGLLRHWIRENELGVLEEYASVRCEKDGLWEVEPSTQKKVRGPLPLSVAASPSLLQAGGWTWDNLNDGHSFGNSVTCNARVGVQAPLPKLQKHRTGIYRQKRFRKSIWMSWCVFKDPLPISAYGNLLTIVEGWGNASL